MPIIANKVEFGDSNDSYSDWRNPNSIVRNTIKLKANDIALFEFYTDVNMADESRYHKEDRVSKNGINYSVWNYCSKRNRNEKGQIKAGVCESCESADRNLTKTSPRYGLWVFCYCYYHPTQNPNLGRYPDAQEWEPFKIGQKAVFRELVMKPQLLELSFTTWERLDQLAQREGTVLGKPYEYSRSDANGRTSYYLDVSTESIPPVADAVETVGKLLPDLEQVMAGNITEFEFPVVDLPSKSSSKKSSDSDFDDITGGVVEEEKSTKAKK